MREMAADPEIRSECDAIARDFDELASNAPSEAYWRAYEQWKSLCRDLEGSIDASQRFSRYEAHERR